MTYIKVYDIRNIVRHSIQKMIHFFKCISKLFIVLKLFQYMYAA